MIKSVPQRNSIKRNTYLQCRIFGHFLQWKSHSYDMYTVHYNSYKYSTDFKSTQWKIIFTSHSCREKWKYL